MNYVSEISLENLLIKDYVNHPFFNFGEYYIKENCSFIFSEFDCYETVEQNVNIKVICTKIFELIIQNSMKTLIIDLNEFSYSEVNCELTVEETYKKYINRINQKDYISLLKQKYPLMFEQIEKEVNYFIEFYKSFLSRLDNDINNIKKNFSVDGNVKSIELGKGDSHCRQNQVLKVNFEHGAVIYKPKDININKHILDMINFIQNNGLENIFRIPQTIAKEDYGWEEFIKFENTNDKRDINNIYYQYGTLACIAYLFNMSDLHSENLIVNGKQLYLIDTESLFQKNINDIKIGNITDEIYSYIKESVVSTLLFPSQISKSNNIDNSGITGTGGQVVRKGKYDLVNKYTSKMRMVRSDFITKDRSNIPSYLNNRVDPRDFTDYIIKGFSDLYKYIDANKSLFTSDEGIINNFRNCKTRVIMRNTNDYSKVLGVSRNPKYLTDEKMRENLLNKMWDACKYNKQLIDIVSSEIDDLKDGDIPYFYSYTNSYDIYNSRNAKCAKFENQDMLDLTKHKVGCMSNCLMQEQIELIKISMAKPIKKWELGNYKINYNLGKYEFNLDSSNILNEVIKITDKIIDKSIIRNETEMSWINIDISENKQWVIAPFDFSLYNGLAGNILLFASLFKVTKINKYKKCEEMCLNALNEMLENIEIPSLSAYWGIGSIIYLYYNLGIINDDHKYIELGKRYLLQSKELIEKENNLDFISGIAGYLVICCNIYEIDRSKEVLEIIKMCADKIIESATVLSEDKVGWGSDIEKGEFLNGFSHGLSGIAYSLMKAYPITNNKIYLDYCMKSINLENERFVDGNWIDLRNRQNRVKKGFPEPVYWCHGAPGIGISRLKMIQHYYDKTILNDIEKAIDATLEKGFNGVDCLCHGALGNLELLVLASITLNDKKYNEKAIGIVNDIKNKNLGKWTCGIPQETPVYSFMTGLSGIAYELLRITNSDVLPSVLCLDFAKSNLEREYEK